MQYFNVSGKKFLVFLFSGMLGLCLAGCGPKKGFVAREWSRNFRELSIEPVFPPREDVLVGDVYFGQDPNDDTDFDDSGYLPIKSHLYYLDVRKELGEFYESRHNFAKTPLNADGKRKYEQPTLPGGVWGSSIKGDVDRARQVAFPSVKVHLANNVNAIFPIEALMFGFGSSEVKDAYLKVSGCETYQIDQSVLRTKLETAVKAGKFPHSNEGYWVEVIQRVYMTREMDYTVQTKSNLNFKVEPLVSAGTSTQSNGGSSSPDKGSESSEPGDQKLTWFKKVKSPKSSTGEETVRSGSVTTEQINTMLNNGSEANGAKFVIVSAQERTVGLKQIFERPLVIGVHSIRARIKNGRVEEYFEGPTSLDAMNPKALKSVTKSLKVAPATTNNPPKPD